MRDAEPLGVILASRMYTTSSELRRAIEFGTVWRSAQTAIEKLTRHRIKIKSISVYWQWQCGSSNSAGIGERQ